MKVITLNVNGIRSAARKGFFTWLSQQDADVVCLQEIKATADQLTDPIFNPAGYHVYYYCAEKKGYSGVAVYSRVKPQQVITGLGWSHADEEGRYLQLDFANLSVASIYLPSGSSGEVRQAVKFDFLARYQTILQTHAATGRPFIIGGDWNIAHKEIDLKNWRGNKKNSGFLPEERAWMEQLLTEWQFVDAFRVVEPDTEHYTWWSNRGQAWAKNVGWRIDYQIISAELAANVQSATIYKAERFSDHAPLTVEYRDLHLKP